MSNAFHNPLKDRTMVVGFAFDIQQDSMVLIVKSHPQWMAGKLNGVGGGVEAGETPNEAMAREFEEETGVPIAAEEWHLFHYEDRHDGAKLYFFATNIFGVAAFADTPKSSDEAIVKFKITEWLQGRHRALPQLYNLDYLVPMAYIYLAYPQHRYDVWRRPQLAKMRPETSP